VEKHNFKRIIQLKLLVSLSEEHTIPLSTLEAGRWKGDAEMPKEKST